MSDAREAKAILVIGGAHLDRRGRLFAPAVPGASNPGRWRIEAGGGAFNAARSLSLLGNRVRLIAPRGGDAAAETVAAAAAAAGLEDTPLTFLDRETPSYTAILDAELHGDPRRRRQSRCRARRHGALRSLRPAPDRPACDA